jgi:hypothetical protein
VSVGHASKCRCRLAVGGAAASRLQAHDPRGHAGCGDGAPGTPPCQPAGAERHAPARPWLSSSKYKRGAARPSCKWRQLPAYAYALPHCTLPACVFLPAVFLPTQLANKTGWGVSRCMPWHVTLTCVQSCVANEVFKPERQAHSAATQLGTGWPSGGHASYYPCPPPPPPRIGMNKHTPDPANLCAVHLPRQASSGGAVRRAEFPPSSPAAPVQMRPQKDKRASQGSGVRVSCLRRTDGRTVGTACTPRPHVWGEPAGRPPPPVDHAWQVQPDRGRAGPFRSVSSTGG